MSMTKKDYEAIAAIIRVEVAVSQATGRDDALGALRVIANGIAQHCARTIPSFQRGRFLTACGVQS